MRTGHRAGRRIAAQRRMQRAASAAAASRFAGRRKARGACAKLVRSMSDRARPSLLEPPRAMGRGRRLLAVRGGDVGRADPVDRRRRPVSASTCVARSPGRPRTSSPGFRSRSRVWHVTRGWLPERFGGWPRLLLAHVAIVRRRRADRTPCVVDAARARCSRTRTCRCRETLHDAAALAAEPAADDLLGDCRHRRGPDALRALSGSPGGGRAAAGRARGGAAAGAARTPAAAFPVQQPAQHRGAGARRATRRASCA